MLVAIPSSTDHERGEPCAHLRLDRLARRAPDRPPRRYRFRRRPGSRDGSCCAAGCGGPRRGRCGRGRRRASGRGATPPRRIGQPHRDPPLPGQVFRRAARRAAPPRRRDTLALHGARRRPLAGRAAGDAQALAGTGRPSTTGAGSRRKLNALPQFTTEIDGVDIHFIHVRSPHQDALPLIMTHGWPGSVIELLETVGPLTDPTAHGGRAEDAFHLVLPSIPGYGFSGQPTEIGWSPARVAQAWAELMAPSRLRPLCRPRRRPWRRRHRQHGPPGTRGAARHPHEPARPGAGRRRRSRRTPTRSSAAAAALATFRATGFGYFLEQATRPQTIGYALLDSPVALAAWMLDHDTDSYYKISARLPRRTPVGQPHPRPHPRQRHALLAYRHRRLGRPVVLGERTAQAAGGGQTPRPSPSRSPSPPSRRDLPGAAQLGRERLPDPHVLQQARQGRALRRLGGAAAVLGGAAGGVPVTSASGARPSGRPCSSPMRHPSHPRCPGSRGEVQRRR